MTVVATDLDRTLVYSRRSAGADPSDRCAVERRDGAATTWTTRRAARLLAALGDAATWVPATTRTRAQFSRLVLPGVHRWAVCAHGGVLLDHGVPDVAWAADVRRRLARSAPLEEMAAGTERRITALPPDVASALHLAEDLFLVTRLDPAGVPAGWAEELAGFAAERGWEALLGERKLHLVPHGLSKGAAVQEIRRRSAPGHDLLAAGDSRLDADLLLAADAAIRPAHGELHALGWHAPHVAVTTADGIRAGEEIADWLLDRVRECSGRRGRRRQGRASTYSLLAPPT